MNKVSMLKDALNDLKRFVEELDPTWHILRGECPRAGSAVQSAVHELEAAIAEIEEVLGSDA